MGCNGKICQKVVLKTLLGVLPKMASRGAAGTFQTKTSGLNWDRWFCFEKDCRAP